MMRRERFDRINVVPFIDIVLVLLVIVLATASFITSHTIALDLPKADSAVVTESKTVTITIDKKGGYFYEGKPASLEAIREHLLQLDPKSDRVALRTDKQSEFQNFVAVVDLLNARQFRSVSIVTLK